MAHFIYLPSDLIKNLTPYSIRSYTSTGGYIILKPTYYNSKDVEETVYIVEDEGRKELEEKGVKKEKIFYAGHLSIGRKGKPVQMILRYKDNARLMPRGEL